MNEVGGERDKRLNHGFVGWENRLCWEKNLLLLSLQLAAILSLLRDQFWSQNTRELKIICQAKFFGTPYCRKKLQSGEEWSMPSQREERNARVRGKVFSSVERKSK